MLETDLEGSSPTMMMGPSDGVVGLHRSELSLVVGRSLGIGEWDCWGSCLFGLGLWFFFGTRREEFEPLILRGIITPESISPETWDLRIKILSNKVDISIFGMTVVGYTILNLGDLGFVVSEELDCTTGT